MPNIARSQIKEKYKRVVHLPHCPEMGEPLYLLQSVHHNNRERIGAKVYLSRGNYYESWKRLVSDMKRNVLQNETPEEQAQSKENKDWLFGYRATRYRIGCNDRERDFWNFDKKGELVDGTTPPPGYVNGRWPRPTRKFGLNQVIGVVFDEVMMLGVIVGKRDYGSGYYRDYEEYDVQASATKPDLSAYRGWVGRADLISLKREDVKENYLYWLASELIDEKWLDELTATLRLVTEDPRPPREMKLPEAVLNALNQKEGEPPALFCLEIDVRLAPDRYSQEVLGLYATKKEILDALEYFVSIDENKNWKYGGEGPIPFPLVMRYIIHVTTIGEEWISEDGSQDDDDMIEIVSLEEDRERVGRINDYYWYFDRKGKCLGLRDMSDVPYSGTPSSELAFKIGDIVSSCRYGNKVPSPGVINIVPPEKAGAHWEMIDNVYFVETGILDPEQLWVPADDLCEAQIELYEGTVTEFQKRRLARMLVIGTLDEIVEGLWFDGERGSM
ncbi:MAG: hypothetical protein HQK54_08640 [Oligoflexales bacterium]|nr:hypothetical protein [Oligoflexales bacterium]